MFHREANFYLCSQLLVAVALKAQKTSFLPEAGVGVVTGVKVRFFATIEVSCLLRNSLGFTEAWLVHGFKSWFEMGHQIESCLDVEL